MSKRIPREVVRITRWIDNKTGWEVELIKPRDISEIYRRLAELEDLEELIKKSSKNSEDICNVLEKYYVVLDSRQEVIKEEN